MFSVGSVRNESVGNGFGNCGLSIYSGVHCRPYFKEFYGLHNILIPPFSLLPISSLSLGTSRQIPSGLLVNREGETNSRSQPIAARGSGSAVSSPSGVWGSAPVASDFGEIYTEKEGVVLQVPQRGLGRSPSRH